MRVLQINKDYTGTGADRCARELFLELPRLGMDTQMWVAGHQASMPANVRGIRFPWEAALAPLETFPDLTDWRHRGSIRNLRKITPSTCDVVHLHIIHSGWMSIRAAYELCRRFPVVWTLHDEWAPNGGLTYNLTGKISPQQIKTLSHGLIRHVPYQRYHENFKWRRTRKFLDRWMPRPRVVICPSRFMLELAQHSGRLEGCRLLHVPNGVRMPELAESSLPRDQARASLGIPSDRHVVLMISADLGQAHKGIHLGLEAIARTMVEGKLHLLLLGANATAIATKIPGVPATCLTARDDQTLACAYRAADVTLLPSLGENFPYVALESLACQTPVVAFPIGGLPEIIGANERGLLTKSIDTGQMAAHLSYLLSKAVVRHQMGEAGRAWVQQHCGMDAYLRRIADIYREIAS